MLLRENVPLVAQLCRSLYITYNVQGASQFRKGFWLLKEEDTSAFAIHDLFALGELEDLMSPTVDQNGAHNELPFRLQSRTQQDLVTLAPVLLRKGLVRCVNQVYLQSRRDWLVPHALRVSEFLHSLPSNRLHSWSGSEVLDLLHGLFRGCDTAGSHTNLPSTERYEREIQLWLSVAFPIPDDREFTSGCRCCLLPSPVFGFVLPEL